MQEELTPREQEIFNLMLDGISPKDIAYRLNVTYSAINYHRNNLYRKLGISSNKELLIKYGSAKPEDMVLVNPQLTNNFNRQVWRFKGNINKRLIISAGFIIFFVSIFMLWNVLFNPFSSPAQQIIYHLPIISHHTGWNTEINSANQKLASESFSSIQITKEIINDHEKDVLNLTARIAEGTDWVIANFITRSTLVIHNLRNGSGIRFKVLGDTGTGWDVTLWTSHGENISYDFPIYTVENKIVEIDIPFTAFMQPVYQNQIQFDKNNITHLVIQRHSPDFSQISGSSTIKIFDFEIY